MNASIKYLQTFVNDFSVLDEKFNCCFQEWNPEIPPDTVIYAQIGDAIADHLDEFSLETQQKIFEKIEAAMTNPDVDVKTAMATGLIEALVTKSDGRAGLWNQFEKLMGVASISHALAWRNFGSQ